MVGGPSPENNHPPSTEFAANERVWPSLQTTLQQTQKNFLVFDQSGGQTMVFRCDMNAPFKAFDTVLSSGTRSPFVANGAALDFRVDDSKAADNNAEESEMREDTDELNALLYSSSNGEFEEDEVDSTGHSPGNAEEVGSTDESRLKRRREWEADAESRRVGECQKIRDTVSVLQKILPGGVSDDPLMVIDEAIGYLKFLKRKAECLELPTHAAPVSAPP